MRAGSQGVGYEQSLVQPCVRGGSKGVASVETFQFLTLITAITKESYLLTLDGAARKTVSSGVEKKVGKVQRGNGGKQGEWWVWTWEQKRTNPDTCQEGT